MRCASHSPLRLGVLVLGLWPLGVVAQNYSGWHDGANCASIFGWAWDANQPNTPINVDIYNGRSLLATAPANLFRQDLLNAGIGNGYHAFNYPTPAILMDWQQHSIWVKVSGTGSN